MKNQSPEVQKKKGNWGVIEEDGFVVVIPISDIKPHGFPKEGETEAELAWRDCPCKPQISYDGGKPMIVHNSFEEAEAIALAIGKLGIQ